jgi:hypothetical protein
MDLGGGDEQKNNTFDNMRGFDNSSSGLFLYYKKRKFLGDFGKASPRC